MIWLYLWPMKVIFFQCIEYNPISILYKFQIDISSNSWEIKYQNIGRTHTHTDRHTDRQTGWKQYLATPSGGEVISMMNIAIKVVYFVSGGSGGGGAYSMGYRLSLWLQKKCSRGCVQIEILKNPGRSSIDFYSDLPEKWSRGVQIEILKKSRYGLS